MQINARSLAAALTYLGADVESALLELASVAPSLDAKVRKELFRHEEPAKLRQVKDRNTAELYFVHTTLTRHTCAMHAVDQVTRVLDDSNVVEYLKSRFEDYNWEMLICNTTY